MCVCVYVCASMCVYVRVYIYNVFMALLIDSRNKTFHLSEVFFLIFLRLLFFSVVLSLQHNCQGGTEISCNTPCLSSATTHA